MTEFLPVFDNPLHNGICSEAVPTINNTQDSFPPWLLDMNETSTHARDLPFLPLTV